MLLTTWSSYFARAVVVNLCTYGTFINTHMHTPENRRNKNAAIRGRSLGNVLMHFQPIYSLMLTNRCCDSGAGKGGWFREMLLIGSLPRVVQRNKSHLFTIWILALSCLSESRYRYYNSELKPHGDAHQHSFSCTHGGTCVLCSSGNVKEKQTVKVCGDDGDRGTLSPFILKKRTHQPADGTLATDCLWYVWKIPTSSTLQTAFLAHLRWPWESPESTCFDLTKLEF